ncbi:MAG: hypothetical protein WBW33_37210 [Bryobacteraceae bacterium]
MIKDNNPPQEQSVQEETGPESLDHEDIDQGEMENISGGTAPNHPTSTCMTI